MRARLDFYNSPKRINCHFEISINFETKTKVMSIIFQVILSNT